MSESNRKPSTPVSLNDESLNGSWIDINSASQIHSQMEEEPPEFLLPPYPNAESVQNLGLISFQVERFLQEAQRNQDNIISNLNTSQQNVLLPPNDNVGGDDNSGIYVSDSETSIDGLDTRALINTLRTQQQAESNNNMNNDSKPKKYLLTESQQQQQLKTTLSKSGDFWVDQLSDSLSILSRGSAIGEATFDQANFPDFDWLWDWTAQPEYFTGQEWKVYAPKQDYLMRQRQLYNSHGNNLFTGDVMSILFLTNILSIIIGAGLTYSIMMRRSSI